MAETYTGPDRRAKPREDTFWHEFMETHKTILFQMSPTVVRLILAMASLFAASILLGSLVSSLLFGTSYKPSPYAPIWIIAFLLHWLGVSWRIIDHRTRRVGWALSINTFGFVLWFVATSVSAINVHGYAHGFAAALALTIFAGWALYRTGMTEEPIGP